MVANHGTLRLVGAQSCRSLQVCPSVPAAQERSRGSAAASNGPLADLAGVSDLFRGDNGAGKEPTDPFTLYGTVRCGI